MWQRRTMGMCAVSVLLDTTAMESRATTWTTVSMSRARPTATAPTLEQTRTHVHVPMATRLMETHAETSTTVSTTHAPCTATAPIREQTPTRATALRAICLLRERARKTVRVSGARTTVHSTQPAAMRVLVVSVAHAKAASLGAESSVTTPMAVLDLHASRA